MNAQAKATAATYRRLFREFVGQYVEQARGLDPLELESIQAHMQASFAHGAAGLAHSLWKVRADDDTELLDLAARWIAAASEHADAHGVASAELQGSDTERSFLHGRAGIALAAAQVAKARGDASGLGRALDDYLGAALVKGGVTELFFGLAGRLSGALAFARATGDGRPLEVADALAKRLVRAEPGLDRPRWTRDEDTSFAHGRAGPLHAITSWSLATGRRAPDWVDEELSRLADEPLATAGTNASSRWRAGSLCGGAAGRVITLVRAFESTHERRYLARARKAARVVLARRGQTNAMVCCGVGGRAYALLALARVEPGGGWRERAWAMTAPFLGPLETGTPLGFLQGYAGLACLAKDLGSPRLSASAGLPIFEA